MGIVEPVSRVLYLFYRIILVQKKYFLGGFDVFSIEIDNSSMDVFYSHESTYIQLQNKTNINEIGPANPEILGRM